MKISIVGGGYVGMALAHLLKKENRITILDVDPDKIEIIRKEFFICDEDNLRNEFSVEIAEGHSYIDDDIVFISVPTSFDATINQINCSIVEDVVEHIVTQNESCLIVIKSTLSVGFGSYICSKYKLDKRLVYCPEFLREGTAINDIYGPERIVIGCEDLLLADRIQNIYKKIYGTFDNYQIVSFLEAEAIKLFSNAYLAMRVAFFNTIDTFSIRAGADANNIIRGVCSDKRIGNKYNNPSFGFGGYCLPKDTVQLAYDLNKLNIDSALIDSITTSNLQRIEYIAKEIIRRTKESDFIGFYRLNVKKESDNLRNSSTLEVIKCVLRQRSNIIVYEPLLSKIKENRLCNEVKVINELKMFKKQSSIIIANRNDAQLDDVRDKVISRDLFWES